MQYLKIFVFVIIFLSGCALITKETNPYTKIEARVENVVFKVDHCEVKTNKGTYICGNCLSVIRAQKYYIFYLKGKKIYKMEEINRKK